MKSAKDPPANEAGAKSSHASKEERQRQLLAVALLEHPSLQKAAASVGISTVTAWRIRKTPEFGDEYRKARREVVMQSLARLQQGTALAVSTLLSVVADPNNSASSRVQAASRVLDYAKDMSVIEDLEYRIARLEQIEGRPRSLEDRNGQTHRVPIEPYPGA